MTAKKPKPVTKPEATKVVETPAAPTPEPAPEAPVVEVPTPEPAPEAPVVEVLTPEPAPEAPVVEVLTPEELAKDSEEDQGADPEPEKVPDKKMVMVRNLRHLDYVQPETQIRIHGRAECLMLDDVWLMLQCNAKLLERV